MIAGGEDLEDDSRMKTRLKKILARVPRSLVSAAVLALLLLLAVAAFKNYRQLQVAQDREEILRQRIEDRRLAVEGLDRQLVRLRENPASLERLARENLGMAYGDELVLILPDESRPALIEAVPIEPVPAESMAARESPALLESTAALESPVRD
jgi:cell division protein FtsB